MWKRNIAPFVAKACVVYDILAQGDFLMSMGLELRLQMLCQKAMPQQARSLCAGASRLVSPRGMGSLFKVLTVQSPLSVPCLDLSGDREC